MRDTATKQMDQRDLLGQPLVQTENENKSKVFNLWDGYLGIDQYTWNIIFAFLSIFGQVAQNISLPLWFASVPDPGFDPLFILTFAGLSFCVIFGILCLVDIYNGKTSFRECLQFTTKEFIFKYCIVGIGDALNGIFLVFAANPMRTPSGIQSILTTLSIFWTILFRAIILKKLPGLLQGVFACIVFIGLFIGSVPTIFGMVESGPFKSEAPGNWKWIWPLSFGFSFAPAAIMNVVGENVLKQKKTQSVENEEIDQFGGSINTHSEDKEKTVNLWYFLFWESLIQELTFFALFWMDALPNFGTQENVSDVGSALKQCWRWFFGLDGAHWYYSTVRALVFVAGYTVSYIGGSLLLRYTEGATWAAMVSALITPIGTIFWFFFAQEGVKLVAQWTWDSSNWYILLGLVIISPAIYGYHMQTPENEERQRKKSMRD